MPALTGILNLNKPQGLTSRDAVNLIQKLARPAKVGHCGTLDPLATGVLVVCVGAATRLIEYVQRMRKRYRGTFLLGRASTTEDIKGDLTLLTDPPIPTREQMDAAAKKLIGRSLQRPPAFSALKIQGRRAYDLARQGESVELEPRPIEVYSLELTRYEYPEFVLEIQCSGGTYVRSLGRDLAASLGTAAAMSALVRTAIGPWSIDDAIDPRQLSSADWSGRLTPPSAAVAGMPVHELAPADVLRVRQGLFVPIAAPEGISELAAMDHEGQLVAILVPRGAGLWGAAKNLPPCDTTTFRR